MATARPAGHVFIWLRAVRNHQRTHKNTPNALSPKAVALVSILVTYMDEDGAIRSHHHRPATISLGVEIGYAESGAIKNAKLVIRELEQAGFLEVDRSGGGRHHKHNYTALVPVVQDDAEGETGSTRTPFLPKRGSSPSKNGVPTDPHPSPPTQIPSQDAPQAPSAVVEPDRMGTGTSKTNPETLTDEDRELANSVIHAVLAGLPTADAHALQASFAAFKSGDVMASRLARLVRDGWQAEVVAELLRKDKQWSTSPYAGATNAAALIGTRVKRLDAQLTRPKVDPASLVPQLRTVNG